MFCLSASSSTSGRHFVESAYTNCLSNDLPCERLLSPGEIRTALSKQTSVPIGDFEGRLGYRNPTGGWAESGRALEVGIKRVRQGGATVRSGCEVVGLIKQGRRVEGVKLKDGEEVRGDLVLVSQACRVKLPCPCGNTDGSDNSGCMVCSWCDIPVESGI